MKFTFEGLQEDSEQGMLTDLLVKQVQSGIRSVDEARDQLRAPAVEPAADLRPGHLHCRRRDAVRHDGRRSERARAGDQKGPPQPSAVPLAAVRPSGRRGVADARPRRRDCREQLDPVRAPGGISAPATGSVSAEKADQIIPAAANVGAGRARPAPE